MVHHHGNSRVIHVEHFARHHHFVFHPETPVMRPHTHTLTTTERSMQTRSDTSAALPLKIFVSDGPLTCKTDITHPYRVRKGQNGKKDRTVAFGPIIGIVSHGLLNTARMARAAFGFWTGCDGVRGTKPHTAAYSERNGQ